MANKPNSKKAVRKIARRTEVNRDRRSNMRSNIRKLEEAIQGGDQAAARAELQRVQPIIMKAAGKGIVHPNNAARKISRLSARVKALGA